jgi:hypothetical protein
MGRDACNLVNIHRRFGGYFCLQLVDNAVDEVKSTSETSVNIYQAARRHNPKHINLLGVQSVLQGQKKAVSG